MQPYTIATLELGGGVATAFLFVAISTRLMTQYSDFH